MTSMSQPALLLTGPADLTLRALVWRQATNLLYKSQYATNIWPWYFRRDPAAHALVSSAA